MADDGVCVFDKNRYYPFQMDPTMTTHEWTLYLGLDGVKERDECLANIKDVVRDCRYMQRAKVACKMEEKYEVNTPTAGELQIYVTEAKNLPIDKLRKELAKNSMKLVSNKLQVKIGFKVPKSMVDLFTSVLINESMIESIEKDLRKDDITVEHDLSPNPCWATAENPAGEMRSIGRLIKLPKSNALLTFAVSVTVVKNGVTQSRVFGSGE